MSKTQAQTALERLDDLRRQAHLGGGVERIERQHAKGKLTARERIEHLLDRGTFYELDEFVAEFECVPRQIGAIILVDDQVVGVERAPSHAYWQSV